MARRIALVALIVMPIAAEAAAQGPHFGGSMGVRMPEPFVVDSAGLLSQGWVRPISSAIIPGSGQLMAGQPRGVIYLAVEAFLLIQFFSAKALTSLPL